MQERTLGIDGLGVSALGLGCMGMSFGYEAPPDKEFTTDEYLELEEASSKIEVMGARYPEHLQKLVGR